MGFLKKIIFTTVLLLSGCAVSIIKFSVKPESELIQSFGRVSSKNFFVDDTLILPLRHKWKFETHGSFAFSSFLAYGNNIITSDLSGRIYTFDLETGKRSGFLKMNGTISVAPIINRHYMIFPVTLLPEAKTSLIFYDFITGKEIQSIEFEGIVLTEIVRNENYFILATENGFVKKINYMGEVLFNIDLEGYTHSSGAMNDKYFFIGKDKGEFVKIELATGKIISRKKISKAPLKHLSISDERVFISAEDGFVYIFNLQKNDFEEAIFFGEKIVMHPAVHDKIIYGGSTGGEFSAYDFYSRKIIWKCKIDNSFAATPLIVGENIVLPSLNKKIYFVNKFNGEIIDSLQYDGRVKTTPIFYNNFLIVGSDNGIINVYEAK